MRNFGMKVSAACLTSVLCLGGPQVAEVRAISYVLAWNFEEPIGSQSPPERYARDLLIYNARTGSLVYEVGERRGERWAPPDIVSASGALRTDQPLEPVPMAYLEAPRFEFDETLGGETILDSLFPLRFEARGGEVVEGSNSIRILYDRLRFWPGEPSDPHILEQWGLEALPTSYDYGEVLPPGLSREFLLTDLYAAPATINQSYVDLVYVVPEPASLCLAGLSLLLVVPLARRHRRGGHPLAPSQTGGD